MPDETNFETIREEYRDLVLLIGRGFHPDTPHDGYEPPLLQITRQEYDQAIDHMIWALGEAAPYDEGLQVCELLNSLSEEEQGRLRMEALDRIIARRTQVPNSTIHAEYVGDPDRDPEQTYAQWLWDQINAQLDILADSSRRLHHILSPLTLGAYYAQELERINGNAS